MRILRAGIALRYFSNFFGQQIDNKVREFEFESTPAEVMEIYLDYMNGFDVETNLYEKIQLLKLTTKINDEELSQVK